MDDDSVSSDVTYDVEDQAKNVGPLKNAVSMRVETMSPSGRPSFPQGLSVQGKKKGKRRKKRRKKKKNAGAGFGAGAPIPGLIKPSAKEATADPSVARSREVIHLMEMKQPSPTKKVVAGGRTSPVDVDSLAFSDDSTLLTDEGSAGTKPNTSKSRKSTAKSTRSRGSRASTRNSKKSSRRHKGQRNMWIDDDDVSLQSLISEMSDYESIASSFDDNRSHVSRELGNKNLAIDDWTNVYPYNQRARPTSISEKGLRMLDENMQYNDPISRPGANTAYEGIRPDRKGLTVEETFSMSQEHKILEVPALMLAPPSLPEVNDHVESEALYLDSITGALRASKGLESLKGLSPGKADTKRATKVDRKSDAGGFTAKEIRMVVKFIDNIGDGEGTGDGSITQDELEAAFRRGRRSQASAAQDSQGQLMVRRFVQMLGDAMTSVDAWFAGVDKNAAGKGDGKLGTLEIKTGIKTLADTIVGKSLKFNEDELISLMRYLDPSGDNELTLEEIKEGIKRSKQTPKAIRDAKKAGAIMCRMTDFMDDNKMTIKNLFHFIDKDRSGHIVLDELRDGLAEMSTSGAEKFAKKKEGLVAARKKKEEEKKLKYDQEVKGRLMKLSDSGAISVLMGLDVHMHRSGQRIIDLFGKSGFDKSGDGALGRREFFKMLQSIGIKCNKAEVKALINIIDDSGDGEIEAYELEKIVRRYRIDNIHIREQEHAKKIQLWKRKQDRARKVPEIEEGENDFVRMMKEQAAMRDGLMKDLKRKDEDERARVEREKAKRASAIGLPSIPKLKKKRGVTSGSVLDGSWLHSFDRSLRSHIRKLDK
ncbi:hypothetical protein TrRE_jg8634 [Triparma retinervis]|uniref:EF-hand domain-containing protein n=1 Tax=Triparma retinervis TaxID=2557542 RepID=A0A9W7F4W7_9STRA|nr:hypothetical protein TrRE_jg8634 [Triparma retinervis]